MRPAAITRSLPHLGAAGRGIAVLSAAIVLAMSAGVGVAHSTILTWIDNLTFSAESSVGTNGYAARSYIEVWRPTGNYNIMCYEHTNGSTNCTSPDSSDNPDAWYQADSYAMAWCESATYNGPQLHYTCQTTS